jgi:hypothetical protein
MADLSHHDIGELSDVIRPLNSLEHLFWLADQNRPVHFAVTAQVSGETSVRDWREALARLKERKAPMRMSIFSVQDHYPARDLALYSVHAVNAEVKAGQRAGAKPGQFAAWA